MRVCQEDNCMNDVHGDMGFCRNHCKCQCEDLITAQEKSFNDNQEIYRLNEALTAAQDLTAARKEIEGFVKELNGMADRHEALEEDVRTSQDLANRLHAEVHKLREALERIAQYRSFGAIPVDDIKDVPKPFEIAQSALAESGEK